MATLKDIFDQAREDGGGALEGELEERYHDVRLWEFFNIRWRRVLKQRVKVNGLSFAGAETGAAGDATIDLATADTKVQAILLAAATPAEEARFLIPTSLAQFQAEGEDPTESGSITHYYLDVMSGLPKIKLWHVPDAAWSLTLFGEGGVTDELSDSSFDDDGMLLTSGGTPPSTISAAQPDQFTLSCISYLAWCIAHTDQRQKTPNPQEAAAWSLFLSQLNEDLSAWNCLVPGRTAQRTSPRVRLR